MEPTDPADFHAKQLQYSQKINQALFDIAWAVNTTADIDELYRFIHKALADVIDVTNFFIAIVDLEKRTLHFPYHVDVTDDDFQTITDFDVNNSLTGLVVIKGRPVLLKKKELEARAAQNGVWGPVPLVWMGVPLIVKDTIIGVMAVQSYCDENMYTEHDLEVLAAVSHQIAIAIDRKRSHDALKKMERRIRRLGRIMDAASNEVYIFESDSLQFLEVNRGAQANLGYSIDEFYHLTPLDLMPEITPRHFETIIQPLKQDRKTEIIFRTIHCRKDGSTYPVEVHLQLLHHETPPVFLAIVNDITERLQMEKEKQQLEKQLHQAQKMEAIGILAGGIAHDFNNILASILGYTELALYDVSKGSQLENHLQEIFKAGNRAKELVRQILSFAHQTDDQIRPVAVKPIAKEALKLIRASIPTTIEIRSRLKSDSFVIGNPTQVHQIFMNLCTNAAQAMETGGGVLEVRLEDVKLGPEDIKRFQHLEPGYYLRIKVSDTGTGIEPDILPSIFEPYFTTKEPGEGTGMGLAIVHGVVKRAGGEITVASQPGKGSTFEIYLPLVSKSYDARSESNDLPVTGQERILFIDDEASIATISNQLLEHLGYKVTTCNNGMEALRLFNADPESFDLVITDMTMPQMTGDTLAREILSIRPDIPVILCTGYSKNFSPQDAAESGIMAYLNKPVTIAELARTVRKVLDRSKG